PGSLIFEHFAHGDVQMRTLYVPVTWNLDMLAIKDLDLPKGVLIGLIYRKLPTGDFELIFPHGSDHIYPADEVTLIGDKEAIADIHRYFGVETQKAKSVVIVGGTLVGVNLARLLQEREIQVRMIDRDLHRCEELADELPESRIIHHDATD